MSALFLTESIRRIERAWIDALGGGVLMDRAAIAVADEVSRLARALPRGLPVVALVGPGNNGGDALLAAAMLRRRGYAVAALSLTGQAPTAEDAARVWANWAASGAPIEPLEEVEHWLTQGAIFIDGLFGIGLARPLDGDAARAARMLGPAWARVVSVDVPSGLDADTGCVVGGRDGAAIRAAVTVTMIGDKPGLHTAAGLDHAGRIVVAALGTEGPLPASAAPPGVDAPMPDGRLLTAAGAAGRVSPRPRDSHKGSFGSVLVVGGASGTTGAALLAARGAQSLGAGRVWIASPDTRVFDPGQPQLMTRDIGAPFDLADALCIGCGLGQSEAARQALLNALRTGLPMVVDADALNLLAAEPALARRLATRAAPCVLTPHPLEAARLLDTGTAAVQSDRITHATRLARLTRQVVILKGAGSIVAAPDGRWEIVSSGAPSLATAGTGDVLAGMASALLARGTPAFEAAGLAAFLHGAAGEAWQARHPSGTGLSAAQLPALAVDALDALPTSSP